MTQSPTDRQPYIIIYKISLYVHINDDGRRMKEGRKEDIYLDFESPACMQPKKRKVLLIGGIKHQLKKKVRAGLAENWSVVRPSVRHLS